MMTYYGSMPRSLTKICLVPNNDPRVIIGSAHTHDISGRSCWWHAYGRPMGLLRVVRLDLFPCEIGLIFKAQMLQIGGIVKAILLPNDF